MTFPASTEPTPPSGLDIIELCLSGGRGGLERHAAQLVPALRARGHRVRVVACPGSEFARLAGVPAALEIRSVRSWPLRGSRRLARLARDADVIHIHRSADLALAACAKRLAGNRPALVYTRHMAITRDRRTSPVHRLLHRRVDVLLAITEKVAEQARRRLPLPAERIRALPLGIGPAPPPADCTRVRPPGRAFVAGCFSRIERAKGQHELVAAIAQLAGRGIDAAALIAGPVMDETYARELARRAGELGVADRIAFLGTLPDVRPVMACCEAVVMPSAAETFGLVLVEAMQMGVPVVATAAGGVGEIVTDGETGLTYPPGDAAALGDCLERLATDRELAAALGRAGRERMRGDFDFDVHLQRLEAFMKMAVRERAGG